MYIYPFSLAGTSWGFSIISPAFLEELNLEFYYSLHLINRFPATFRGFAYVGFKTEEEFNNSLRKDRSFILGNRISVRKLDPSKNVTENPTTEKLSRWAAQTAELEKECETVGESGRIFIRNLSYTSTEDQIQEFFEKVKHVKFCKA